MSSERATQADSRRQAPADGQDAQPAAAALSERHEDACKRCGAAIPRRVARVCGDNQGRVAVCKQCAEPHDGRDAYNTTTAAIIATRRRGGLE